MPKFNKMFLVLAFLAILALAGIAVALLNSYARQSSCRVTPQTVARSNGNICAKNDQ